MWFSVWVNRGVHISSVLRMCPLSRSSQANANSVRQKSSPDDLLLDSCSDDRPGSIVHLFFGFQVSTNGAVRLPEGGHWAVTHQVRVHSVLCLYWTSDRPGLSKWSSPFSLSETVVQRLVLQVLPAVYCTEYPDKLESLVRTRGREC